MPFPVFERTIHVNTNSPAGVVKCLWEVFVWGCEVLFLS